MLRVENVVLQDRLAISEHCGDFIWRHIKVRVVRIELDEFLSDMARVLLLGCLFPAAIEAGIRDLDKLPEDIGRRT